MVNLNQILTYSIILLFINSCANKEPLFIKKPLDEAIPTIKKLEKKGITPFKKYDFYVSLPKRDSIYVDFISTNSIFQYRNSPPSIVIALPQKLDNRELIEQLLETSLIKKGFSVIDRSKLEAKSLEKKGEFNLSNISELLMVAQKGYEVDYILQINNIETKMVDNIIFDLMRTPISSEEIINFQKKHIGLKLDNSIQKVIYSKGFQSDKFPINLNFRGFRFYLNAKIINIHSGNIDWLGTVTCDNRDIDHSFQFRVQEVDSSDAKLNKEIDEYNRKIGELYKKVKNSYIELQELYSEGEKEVSPFSLRYYSDSLKDDILMKKREFNENLSKLKLITQLNLKQKNSFDYRITLTNINPITLDSNQFTKITKLGIEKFVSIIE
jgi:hypothetical protein